MCLHSNHLPELTMSGRLVQAHGHHWIRTRRTCRHRLKQPLENPFDRPLRCHCLRCKISQSQDVHEGSTRPSVPFHKCEHPHTILPVRTTTPLTAPRAARRRHRPSHSSSSCERLHGRRPRCFCLTRRPARTDGEERITQLRTQDSVTLPYGMSCEGVLGCGAVRLALCTA
jgi:hypothetical protein